MLPARSAIGRIGHPDDPLADERRVVVERADDAEALGDEAGVGGERVAEVAHPDDGDRPVLGQAEGAGDLEREVLDLVADAAHAVGAEVAQVLAQLGGAHPGRGGELLGRDRRGRRRSARR